MNTQQLDALFIGFGKGGKTLAAFLAQKGWENEMINLVEVAMNAGLD